MTAVDTCDTSAPTSIWRREWNLPLGTLFLLPMILGYVGFVYWLFRGKVRAGESYH